MSRSGGNEGLGFAIPANIVRDVYMQVRKNGQVKRGEIGLFAQNITPPMAQGLALSRDHGVIVADVDSDGPAGRVGLQHGDIVVSLDDQKISSVKQLQNHLFRSSPGDTVRLGVLRRDKELTLSPVLRDRSSKGNLLSRLVLPEKNIVARLGILCVEVDREIAAMIPNLRHQYGLIIAAKSPGGQAQLLDLQQGDIVQAINTVPVSSVEGLKFSLEEMKPGDPVVLEIDRDGRLQYVAFELDR